MGRLYCNCLNVVVHYSGQPSEEGISSEELLLVVDSSLPHHLCNKKLIPVTIDAVHVTSKQSSLVKTYKLGETWSINSCINCSTDVYAISTDEQQKGRMFIFNNLIADPSTLRNHSDYSVVFQLILRENKTQTHSFDSFEQVGDKEFKTVYEQSQSFLSEEEQKMELNIREYEKKQREEFKKLKEKVQEDRRRLLMSLNEAKDTSSNVIKESSLGETNTDSSRKEVTSVTIPLTQELITPARHIIETTNNEDDIFDFDEDLVEGEQAGPLSTVSPFPFSSDDDDTDSSSNEGSLSLSEDKYRVKNIPSSLPLSMPFLSFNKQTSDINAPMRHTPTDLAQSIQKLALSVHDTGMFGDLPKPRVKNSHR